MSEESVSEENMSEGMLSFTHNRSDHVTSDPVESELMENHSSMIDKVVEREALNQQIEEFLNSGGRISHIEANVMADPPKKPENRYGSQPI